MKNYKDLITISLKKNYRNSTNFQKNFIILYKSHRNNLSKKIIIKQTVNNKIKKNDLTFNQIKDSQKGLSFNYSRSARSWR